MIVAIVVLVRKIKYESKDNKTSYFVFFFYRGEVDEVGGLQLSLIDRTYGDQTFAAKKSSPVWVIR